VRAVEVELMRARAILAGGSLAAALLLSAAAITSAAQPDTQFFVYEGETQTEPIVGGTITVCTFHLEAIPAGTDDHETGNWEIRATGGNIVLSGEYETTGSTGDRIPDTGTFSLADGSYQLLWDSEPIDTSHWTKAFDVACGGAVAPTATPPGAVAPTGTALPTTGVNPTGAAAVTLPPTDEDMATRPAAYEHSGTWLVAVSLGVLSALVLLASPRMGTRPRRIDRDRR
jgi:hypothetical protein